MYRPIPAPLRPAVGTACCLLLTVGCLDYGFVNPHGGDDMNNHLDPYRRDDTEGCWDGTVIPTDVSIDESCLEGVEAGDLDPIVEWSMDSFMPYPEWDAILMTPVVGHLTDDDGDGQIGPGDVPDILAIFDETDGQTDNGILRVISGDGSVVHLTIQTFETGDGATYHPNHWSNAALGDIDSDGLPEAVFTVVGRGVPDADPEDPPEGGEGKGHCTGGPEDPVDTGGEDPGGFSSPGPPPPSEPADGQCYVAAMSHEGELEWISEASFPCTGHAPALADLDGDNEPEVVLGNVIMEGYDGSTWAIGLGGYGYFPSYEQVGYHSFPADLDGDGRQELLAGYSVYDSDGHVVCTTGDESMDGFPAVADFDADGLGEFVVVGDSWVRVFEHDCAPVAEWQIDGGGNGGPPTIADFDGDGQPEIGAAAAQYYSVWEYDGELLWSMPVTDASSHATGSSVYDFDGDGRAEVVYADEVVLWIFDGASGKARLEWDEHSSRTLHEYPVVVDVDGDGMTEVIVPNGGGHYDDVQRGIMVLGSLANNWTTNRQVWNQHAYSITNIEDDLSIPSQPNSNWPTYNNFRCGYIDTLADIELPDAVSLQGEFCEHKCDEGELLLMVGLGSGGVSSLPPDLPVSLYAEIDERRYLLGTQYSQGELTAGTSEELLFTINVMDVPEGVVVLVADDEGGEGILNECNEANNELKMVGVQCP